MSIGAGSSGGGVSFREWFVNHIFPWFYRGGSRPDGFSTGVFNFEYKSATMFSYISFRKLLK